ncbi:MAG: hypothetical protein ABSE49_21495 [Polyangiaceae bacterium]
MSAREPWYRRKGREFERAVQLRMEAIFGRDFVRRGVKASGGASPADVVAPGVWIECKAHHRTNPRGALRQAERGARLEGLWPVAICKDDGKEPLVMMRLDDFAALLRAWHALRVARGSR